MMRPLCSISLYGVGIFCNVSLNNLDDRVDRASASVTLDSGSIPSQVKPMTLKLVFTASLLDAHH